MTENHVLNEQCDVILLDARDGESLAYNHAYENLRLGAVAAALKQRGRLAHFADLSTVESLVAVTDRPLLVVDAFFRVVGDVIRALAAAKAANPEVTVLCFGGPSKLAGIG